jgi:hypothetical protein
MLLLVDQRHPVSATQAAEVVKRFWQLPRQRGEAIGDLRFHFG